MAVVVLVIVIVVFYFFVLFLSGEGVTNEEEGYPTLVIHSVDM